MEKPSFTRKQVEVINAINYLYDEILLDEVRIRDLKGITYPFDTPVATLSYEELQTIVASCYPYVKIDSTELITNGPDFGMMEGWGYSTYEYEVVESKQ